MKYFSNCNYCNELIISNFSRGFQISNNSSTASQSTEEGKVVAIESGSGSGSDATASLYRG